MRLVALAVLLSACISIPKFQAAGDGGSDGARDTSTGPLTARWISNAYREGGMDGQATGTQGMSSMGWSIPTNGIIDGDLVIFVANVDNGGQGFWILPTGFSEI